MAKLEISGMDDLNAAFGRIKAIPHDVTSRALDAHPGQDLKSQA